MKKSRFTTDQIIGFIKQLDANMGVAELARTEARMACAALDGENAVIR